MSIKWEKWQKINIRVDFLPRSLQSKLQKDYSVFAILGGRKKNAY